MKRFAVTIVLGALAMTTVPSRAEAQGPYVFLGGGFSKPVGAYSDAGYKSGWMMTGGIGADVGKKGFFIEGEAFFGSNSQKNPTGNNDKNKTNLIGFLAALGKSFGAEASKVHPYLLVGAGILGNQYRTDNDALAGLERTENKFSYSGAGGVSFTLNEKANFWVEARYLGSSGFSVIPIMAGITIHLGKSK